MHGDFSCVRFGEDSALHHLKQGRFISAVLEGVPDNDNFNRRR